MRVDSALLRRRARFGSAFAVLLAAFGAWGCKNSLVGSDTGVWTIRVSAVCTAVHTTNIQVFVDNSFRGYAQPGDSGVSAEVAVGNHSFYAIAGNGTQWGPSTDYVGSNGVTTTLNCNGLVRTGGNDFTTERGLATSYGLPR